MKHQQYEDWILEDTDLNQEHHRELQIHLKQCSQCLALYQAVHQIAHLFKTTPDPEPEPDFSRRWLLRVERTVRRKNRFILGVTLGGISLATAILLISVGFQINTAAAGFPQMLLNMVTMVANWIVFLSQLSNIIAPLFRVSVKLISPIWLYTIGISISIITSAWIFALTRSRTLQKEIQS
jgi:predicted anti-sigma-YlaC factor YlaD